MTPSSPVACSSSLDLATSPLGEPFRASRGPRPLAAQPGRVAISTRSNALYDRCAAQRTRVERATDQQRRWSERWTMTAGESTLRPHPYRDASKSARTRRRITSISAGERRFGGSGGLGPLPCGGSFCRSRMTVDGKVMWSPDVQLPRRNLDSGLAGGRLRRSSAVRISSYFRTL